MEGSLRSVRILPRVSHDLLVLAARGVEGLESLPVPSPMLLRPHRAPISQTCLLLKLGGAACSKGATRLEVAHRRN